jgi:23S rRNA pseudouridine2604 synthase
MSENGVRINKYLSEIGFCSRRAADQLIEEGRVTINGKVPEMGTKVMPGDEVHVNGKSVVKNEEKEFVYIALNKPVGIVCTTDTSREEQNIVDFVNYPTRIFPIGRLDKASEGLIFLTNDGDIVNKILRSRNGHEKEYEVTVNRPVTPEFIHEMASGVPILDTVTKKCFVKATGSHSFRIILTQGLNRQIRRMCEHFGYHVRTLRRVRIMNVTLDVPLGRWRYLSDREVKDIQKMVDRSSKVDS